MSEETVRTLRHILDARIDNAIEVTDYFIWCSARDIIEYAIADNLECLNQFDYLPTRDEPGFENVKGN